MKILLRLLISAAAIFGVAYFSDGSLLTVDGWQAAGLAAIVLGLVNLIIKPLVKLVTLPVTIFTLGLFGLVINTLMLYIVALFVEGLGTVGFFQTMLAALIISAVTSVATWFVDKD